MILKFALAGVLLLAPVPAVPQVTATVPVDSSARAKFPGEDGAFVDALAMLNKFVNANITYTTDREHYGKNDFWVMAPADGKGDCEDYALTKEYLLSEAGFSTVTNTKLVLLVVHDKSNLYGHAILAVKMPKGAIAYLDLTAEPMTKAELLAKGYEFQDWHA
jgi:predicted transglutaminase-like cysteine proteinase